MRGMVFLYAATALALLVSVAANRKKTLQALVIAGRKFLKILPAFLMMLVLVSIILSLIPGRTIAEYLGGDNLPAGVFFASFFGSIAFMPGFIAFPLCGILLEKGVPYTVLSAFTTTLMMVGIVTFPIEKEYFGVKASLLRNATGLLIALAVAFATGVFFGEILP